MSKPWIYGAPWPMARILSQQHREEPVYWRWPPPSEDEWEWARTDHYRNEPVEDEEDVAFRVLERWCRYRCGTCGRSDGQYRIVMDHDHSTGLCRGMLCSDCNRREGFGGGQIFAMYRERPPAQICDVKVTYWAASLLPASPDILRFQEDLQTTGWLDKGRYGRRREPWLESELRIASRDDLTTAEIADILGRTEPAVISRRRSLTIGLPNIDI